MSLVAAHTTIALPRVFRSLPWRNDHLIFMEYVDGEDLEVAWPNLSLWRKFRVMWTIRTYIRQLRHVPLPHPHIPGPFDGSGVAFHCNGRPFTENGAGPFATYGDMVAWFQRKLLIADAYRKSNGVPPTPANVSFDHSEPLVLVHGDICMRNIRLGKDGTVWLIDWGFSGAFPPWFEYSGIMAYDDGRGTPKLWLKGSTFMAGCYKRQHVFLQRIEVALVLWAMDL
ncbi:hypothetical protein FA95DRAFT_1293482 [Auriscalpium vulgare]|uniref:Uncharacterized protein n=1 Tax=Auriscalpium vulgare TaxID=40419 RepID=A0ACB8RT17_9AGAM|nr:hypothetical protein FA95DRAFT_1293482 [Auriscalpium vulgare]